MGRMNGLVLSLGALGFGILYLPIIIMIIFSFNAGKLVSVWSGASLKWYAGLLEND